MLIADDLNKLLEVLPDFVRIPLEQHENRKNLIEVVMDLGRRPEARFPSGPNYLSNKMISWQDLDFCIRKIGNFSSDNRSGIERTLHRISSIRNRQGSIVGLTCRVAGDGDIPHPAIGRARRMQVARPELQHQVMIEAVENHMPEVIIIDEIGTELEALAARTIAERGVQLVGTAHGNYLESLIKNPILADLVGGIQYVTLGDDEAKRRGTQKSILERKAAPAFQIAIEIHKRNNWIVHENVDESVDQILQGYSILTQRRVIDSHGHICIDCEPFVSHNNKFSKMLAKQNNNLGSFRYFEKEKNIIYPKIENNSLRLDLEAISSSVDVKQSPSILDMSFQKSYLFIYPYFVNIQQIEAIINTLALPLFITKDAMKADAILALRSSMKKNNRLRQIAKTKNITIYTIYSSTVPHITRALRKLLNLNSHIQISSHQIYKNKNINEIDALEEVREAVEKIVIGKKEMVELLFSVANLRKMQHHLVKLYNVKARSFGEEPNRRLRIYP